LTWEWSATSRSGQSQIGHFFLFRSKEISWVQVKKYSGQRQVGPFFTASHKYARVGSCHGPSLLETHMNIPFLIAKSKSNSKELNVEN